ncbi:MAG: hypothetical protein LBQ34_02505 [Alphaproteobacteria bacterium]|jgi:hypothetical protein|nr:hypothetical protein [Alphaproteobacteria bacterium]
MKYVRIAFVVFFVSAISISSSYATEYICSFDTMLTADVNRYSPNYQQILEIKARSKFVFDITEQQLFVNGQQFVTVYVSPNNGLFVYSDRDFPYVMFYFYPNESKLIMVGMQESGNDVFLKSDSFSCWNSSRGILPSVGIIPEQTSPFIVSTPLTPNPGATPILVPAPVVPAPVPEVAAPVAEPAPTPTKTDFETNLLANQPPTGIGEEIIIAPPQ